MAKDKKTTSIKKTKEPAITLSLSGFPQKKVDELLQRLGLKDADAIDLFLISLLVVDIATEEGGSKIVVENNQNRIVIDLKELGENVKNNLRK